MQASVVERLFSLKENGTSVSQEVSAGVTTFMAMSYLIFVIPSMLADGGIPRDAATSSVILVTVAVTLLMGLWARYPVGVAPGLGITPTMSAVPPASPGRRVLVRCSFPASSSSCSR